MGPHRGPGHIVGEHRETLPVRCPSHTIMVIQVIKIFFFFLYSSSVYSCYLFLISSASVRSIPFHAKMGSIRDRNGMDITEAEDIKKRWQEYTEELYKKAFLSDQSKEIEESNRMGKTRDLSKKIRDTKGIFPAKIAQ